MRPWGSGRHVGGAQDANQCKPARWGHVTCTHRNQILPVQLVLIQHLGGPLAYFTVGGEDPAT